MNRVESAFMNTPVDTLDLASATNPVMCTAVAAEALVEATARVRAVVGPGRGFNWMNGWHFAAFSVPQTKGGKKLSELSAAELTRTLEEARLV